MTSPISRLLPTLVFLHGGGWVIGRIEPRDGLCWSFANTADFPTFSVGFPAASEHPFPSAIEEVVADAAVVHDVGAHRRPCRGSVSQEQRRRQAGRGCGLGPTRTISTGSRLGMSPHTNTTPAEGDAGSEPVPSHSRHRGHGGHPAGQDSLMRTVSRRSTSSAIRGVTSFRTDWSVKASYRIPGAGPKPR
jgi:hypothetical protein